MKKIAFIGAGNMASAIVGGILSSNISKATDIVLYDKNVQQYSKFDNNCVHATSIEEATSLANFVFLSVKPQNIKDVLSEIKSCQDIDKKVFVSICAGITMDSIKNTLGNVKIARAMPNTPLLIGQGTTGLCQNSLLNNEEFNFVFDIFSSAGLVAKVNEEDINNVTALTGSSPAYVYLFVKALVDGAAKLGFNNENATKMVCNTLIGSANMILNSDMSIDELIKMVTSPNGTTEKALIEFDNNDFCEIVYKAMKACSDRADELSKLN
ncbi:MAG: pyrroline-5-carboxylate reductase [Clostridia bacterium]|nr:pyrroline-5-carboxylate reductase [Clostridia bacterium]